MSNEKKQSSVEWLFEQVWINPVSKLPEILNQAKAMHREEIKQAYADGFVENVDDEFINEHPTLKPRTAQKYYNETFKP